MSNQSTRDLEDKGHNIVVAANHRAQPPVSFTGLKLAKVPVSSAGMPAVFSALGHARRYMGVGIAYRTMFKVNQKGGFDCPGCAWPDPDDERSAMGEYCENGIKAIAEEAQKKTIGAAFFAANSVETMRQWSDFQLGKQGRLAEPVWLKKGATHYTPVSWDDAFARIASALNGLPSPDQAVFYTSGRTSNEAAFLYQLFVRAYGTNNLPDCSNMCHESSGHALAETVGYGKGTVRLEDFYEAELVIVIGQNPGTNHPRMLSALEKCKKNGGKIISINPLQEAGMGRFVNPQRPGKMLGGGTQLADLFLPVQINGDVALLKAIISLLWYEEKQRPGQVFDWDFITQYTTGYEQFIEDIKTYDFNELTEACGVPRDRIKLAVDMIRRTQKIIVCWAMGLTQHENGVDNIKEIVNLMLLKGAVGRPGAGLCPVRGHSNVQGDRTMGIWETPPPAFLDKLEEVSGYKLPRQHGYATVDAIKAMHAGKARVFFAMGGNFLSASPDTLFTAEALSRCQLTVHVSTKLNRSHLVHGEEALILPCLGRTDIDMQKSGPQWVTTENSMGVVQMSKGVLPPASSQLLSEPAIVARLAMATLGARGRINWQELMDDYGRIRDLIAQVLPDFYDYNERARKPGGFYLPNPPRERRFLLPDGRAHFSVNKPPRQQLADGEFVLMTIRSHDQFNTTIYGLDDRYRGIFRERRVVMMNPEDMAAAGLKTRDLVDIRGDYKGVTRCAERFIVVPYDIPRRCLATYFPEANVLVPVDSYARGSKTPVSKRVVVKIKKLEAAG
jgi:molybdopterin-dependent oxidoreductase alpha subunit